MFFRIYILSFLLLASCTGGEGSSGDPEDTGDNYVIPATPSSGGGGSSKSYDTAKANLKFDYEDFDILDDKTGKLEVEVFADSGFEYTETQTITKDNDIRELIVPGIPVGLISFDMQITTEHCYFHYWGTIDLTVGQVYVIQVYFPKTCKTEETPDVSTTDSKVFYVGVYEGQGQDTYQNGRPLGEGEVGVIVTRKESPAILVLTSDRPTVFNIDIKDYSAGVEAVIISGKYPSSVKGIPSDTPVYASSEFIPNPLTYGAGDLKSSSIPVFHAFESDAGTFSDFKDGKAICVGSGKKPDSRWLDAQEIIFKLTGKEVGSADADKIGHTYHITDFSEIWDLPDAAELDESCL